MNAEEYSSDEMEFDSIKMQDGEPHQTLMFDIKDGKVEPVLELFEDSIASDVYRITERVKKIIQSRDVLFDLEKERFPAKMRPNTLTVKAGSLGNTLLRCLKLDLDRVIDKYPEIGKYNRYFGIYYDAVMRDVDFEGCNQPFATVAKEKWLYSQDKNCWLDTTLRLFVERSNSIVEEIRWQCRSERFSQWKRAVERQSKDNFDTLWSLVLACLNVNHHALVLRFDLGYPQFYRDSELSGVQVVTYEDIRCHRVALRLFLKRELKKRLPNGACKGMGFAIKLEYGLDKECHFHVIVILNGDVVRQDVTIVDMIGDYWQNVITRGKGGLYNCNKAKYVSCGIGSVRYDNAEKLGILETVVVPYLVKPDFYMKMVKPDAHRSFWPSHPPKIEAKRKGRKRGKTGVPHPLLKATPVADLEECLRRFSGSTGEHVPSRRTDSGVQQNQIGMVARSIDKGDSGDIPWNFAVV
jgi:hypothetical protein